MAYMPIPAISFHGVRRQKCIAPGIGALGIEELPKRVSAEESGTPVRKQVWVQYQTLILQARKAFHPRKGSLLPVVSMMQATDAPE
jgi:hypothetical protein